MIAPPTDCCEYVRVTYGVPAYVGMRVSVGQKDGTIVSAKADNHHIHVRFDGERHASPCHPTSGVKYFVVGITGIAVNGSEAPPLPPQRSEKENDDTSRVEPLNARIDAQDLSQSDHRATSPITRGRNAMSFDAEKTFTYHEPKGTQQERYQALRAKAKELAILIETSCPPSREASLALTNLQQTTMWANAAIAINEA